MVVIYKKTVLIIAIISVVFVFAMGMYSNNQVVSVMNNNINKKLPVYRVDVPKKIALTFDAAWGANKTEDIINILQNYNVKGTFFLVGFWIDKYPDLVRKIHECSFEIANHSLTHLDMTKLDKEKRRNEIESVNEKIISLIGESPKFFRFPFGAYNRETVLDVENLNMISIQWDVDSLDWKGINKQEILSRIKKNSKDGSIILFHNNSEHVLDALPLVIEYLKEKGFELVTLSEMVYFDNFTIDLNGEQHRNVINGGIV